MHNKLQFPYSKILIFNCKSFILKLKLSRCLIRKKAEPPSNKLDQNT